MTQEDSEAARALGLVHGQVCYLQIPAANHKRAAAFYEAVFGWQIEAHYPDFEAPGLIGQWVEGRPPTWDAGPMIWIHVADMRETLERGHCARRRDPRASRPRWPDPHPRHDHRSRRQPHRPGRPRAAALTSQPSRPSDSASGGTATGKHPSRSVVTV